MRGSDYKAEIRQFLADYHLAYIRSLLNVASSQGGAAMSQALVDELQETARKHNWQIMLNARTVLDSTVYPLEVLREALPVLVETAKGFVSKVTGPEFVEAHMKEQSARFSEAVHRDAARYGKPDSEVAFADNR